MTDETFDISDTEQEERLILWRKLGQMILMRYAILLFLFFALVLAGSIYLIYRYRLKATDRFESHVTLVYYPRPSSKVKTVDDRQIMQLIRRRQTIVKLAEELGMNSSEISSLMNMVSIEADKKRTNVYNLGVKGATSKEAIQWANTLSDVCMREYVAYRTKDLERWEETVQIRRRELQDSLAKIEQEDLDLGLNLGVQSPENELDRLNKSIKTHKEALSDVNVQLIRVQGLKEAKEALVKAINPAMLVHATKIKAFLAELEKMDKEILMLRELYTEKNPRLTTKLAQRAGIQKEFDDFKKDNNITDVDPAVLSKLDKVYEELRNHTASWERLNENKMALEREIRVEEDTIKRMQELIPKSKQLAHQRAAVASAQQDLENLTSDINYQKATMKNDLTQVESAVTAKEEPLISQKMIVCAIIFSCLMTSFLLVIVSSLELAFGRIVDGELAFYPELRNLGRLLSQKRKFNSEEEEKMVYDSIFYNFETENGNRGIVFLGALPGVNYCSKLLENFEWNYAMSGKRLLSIFIVEAMNYEAPSNSIDLSAVSYSGSKGALPVENISALSPSELQMLESDIKELRNTYDLIIVTRRENLDLSGVFLQQMLTFCDSSIILAAVKHTKRSMIRAIIRHQHKTGKPMMTIATNSHNISAVINVDA